MNNRYQIQYNLRGQGRQVMYLDAPSYQQAQEIFESIRPTAENVSIICQGRSN